VPRTVDPRKDERAAELSLARACARGEPAAIATLETRYISTVAGALHRLRLDPDTVSEVQQRVREVLLVGRGRPGIAEFRGSGPLKAFVRIIALREAVKLKRTHEHEVSLEDAMAVEQAGEAPEITYLRKAHGAHLKRALRDAVAALTPRERTMLRQYFIDGLSIDELGLAWQVHRATAARQVTRAHQAWLGETQRILRDRLNFSESQVQSVVRAVASRFDLSLATSLRDAR
jgi:RNA polymerase sigma-70 factor, ECF subfamily